MQPFGQFWQQRAAQHLLHGTTSTTNSRSAKLQPRRPHHAPGVGRSRAWRACQVRPSGTRILCLQEAWHANRCEVRRKLAARLGQLQTEFCRGAKADHSRSCLGHVVAMEDVSGCLQRSASFPPMHPEQRRRDAGLLHEGQLRHLVRSQHRMDFKSTGRQPQSRLWPRCIRQA